jgi:serine/threonine protein kinase
MQRMTDSIDPAEAFEQLWSDGPEPSLTAFVAGRTGLSAEKLAELIRIDQERRSSRKLLLPAEEYLRQFPQMRAHRELEIDIVYHEYLLREQESTPPTPAEFVARFPDIASVLGDQIKLHAALVPSSADGTPDSTLIGETPSLASSFAPRFEQLPAHFGRYGVLALVGRGGMGDVYLAEDVLLGRRIALKLPRFDRDQSGESLSRFRREAQIAAGFHHPHLCPVYDFGEVDGVWYLTMPYIAGRPVSSLIAERGRVPPEEAVALVAQVARAMEVAHRAGVVHRDLKPANILVQEDGQPIVTDFGLARSSGRIDSILTGAGALVGTPAYMAPEQIGAAADDVGPASDLYSLGVVLYEMLTGRPPFQGPLNQVWRQVLVEKPPPISDIVPGISPHLESICFKALSKEPKDRFGSMEEFASALEELSDNQPPPNVAFLSKRDNLPRRSLSWRTVLAAGGVLVALGVGLWFAWPGLSHPSNYASVEAADELSAGSQWNGRFQFVGMDYTGPVGVTISEREGDAFRGTYETENGDYVWRIAGALRGEKINWEFTDVVREKERRTMVGRAYVEGTCRASKMEVVFRHPGYGSQANMVLTRVR